MGEAEPEPVLEPLGPPVEDGLPVPVGVEEASGYAEPLGLISKVSDCAQTYSECNMWCEDPHIVKKERRTSVSLKGLESWTKYPSPGA